MIVSAPPSPKLSSYVNDTVSDHHEEKETTSLDEIVLESLQPAATGLSVLYLIFTISHALVLPASIATYLVPVASATSLAFITFFALLRRRMIREHLSHRLAAVTALLVLLNSLLHLELTQEPYQTINVMLVILGSGFIFLSRRWLILLLAASHVGWGLIAWWAPPSPGWTHFGFALLSATVLSVMVFIFRLRTLRRLIQMRQRDDERKLQLEAALAATEQAHRSLEQRVEERTAKLRAANGSLRREIAERRRIEDALRDSEERYRALFEYNPSMYFTVDPVGTVLSVNGFGAEQLGFSQEELIGKPVLEVFHPEDRDRVLEQLRNSIENPRKILHWEFRKIRKDGSMLWVKETVRVVNWIDGKPVALIVCEDITERKQMLERLRESEEQYRLLFENNPHPMWLIDGERVAFLAVNDAAVRNYGYTREEFLRMTIREIRPPEDVPALCKFLKEMGRQHSYGEVIRIGTWRHRRKDGSLLFAEITVSAVSFQGRLAWLVLADDVTERHQAEQAFHHLLEGTAMATGQEFFNTLVRHLAHWLGARWAMVAVFEERNGEKVRMLSFWDREAHVESPAFGFTAKSFGPILTSGFYVCANELQSKRSDDSVFQEMGAESMVGKVIRGSSGETVGLLCALDDKPLTIPAIAETIFRIFAQRAAAEILRQEAEKERTAVEARLQRAQKMEMIGTLAGGIAHDFNNQLTGIIGNISLSMLELGLDHPGCTNLREVEKAARRCAEMTRAMLTFGRQISGALKPVSLNDIVREVYHLLGRAIPAYVQIEIDTDANLWTVMGDSIQMQQVLMNLCINARDAILDPSTLAPRNGRHQTFSRADGLITITTRNEVIAEEQCQNNVERRPGRFVMLSVEDNGSGMPPEIAERIFEPFFTTKEVGKGTGLGLAMVFGIVKSHGGWIEVDSRPGSGTTFKVYFPQVDSTIEEEQAQVELLPGSNETIMVVDDEPMVRDVTRALLNHNGYKVITANDGVSALELYRKLWLEIDLVLLDLTMPKMSGKEVFQRMLEINPDAAVIISSGFALENEANEVLRSGASAFVHKPYVLEDLLRVVRKCVEPAEGEAVVAD